MVPQSQRVSFVLMNDVESVRHREMLQGLEKENRQIFVAEEDSGGQRVGAGTLAAHINDPRTHSTT